VRAGRLHLRGPGKEDPSIVVNVSGHGGFPVRPYGGPVLTSFRLGSNATGTCGGNRPAAPARPGGVDHRRYGAKLVADNPVSWTSARLRSKDGEDRVHASTLRCLASRQRHRPRPGRVCVFFATGPDLETSSRCVTTAHRGRGRCHRHARRCCLGSAERVLEMLGPVDQLQLTACVSGGPDDGD
jgi:hypothetical protein